MPGIAIQAGSLHDQQSMSKPVLSLPVLVSAGIAAITATFAYTILARQPSNQSNPGLNSSTFQTDFLQQKHIPSSASDGISTQEADRWRNYSGKLGNDVLYYIFVDRFFDGDPTNNRPRTNPASNGSAATAQLEQKLSDAIYDPSHRLFGLYFGGDLEGVRKKLPYLAELGVTKIVLSPIQEGAPGFRVRREVNMFLDNGDGTTDRTGRSNLLANYHGYWIRDWFRLDPRMRSEAKPDGLKTLSRLLDEAHRYNIGVILDLTLHHTSLVAKPTSFSPDSSLLNVFPALGEVRKHGKILANVNSQPDWYYPACQMDYGRPTTKMLTTCQIDAGLPTLNHGNPIVKDYLLKAAEFWMKANPDGAQVAGIRIDAIKHIDAGFVRKLVEQTRRINPQAVIFAEDFGGGSQTVTTADILDSVGDISTIDFSFTNSMRYFFSGDRSWTGNRTNVEASSLGDIKTQDLSTLTPNWFANPAGVLTGTQDSTTLFPINYPASKSWITSLETHDAPRMRTFRHQMSDPQYAAMVAFHFVARGVPMINYGAETGLSVPPLPRNSGLNGLGGDPFNRQMMIWPGQSGFNRSLFETTKTFVHLRRNNPVLRYGDTIFLRPIPDRWRRRPLLMLRVNAATSKQQSGDKAFLYAFSPEGGRFHFRLPASANRARSLCDVQTKACIPRDGQQQLYSVILRPDVHRVLEITF